MPPPPANLPLSTAGTAGGGATTLARSSGPVQLNTTNFFNRDLSWLEFNRRVLAQAKDTRVPLLERLKFLAIYSSNSDEFFMKRVGLLRRKIAQKSAERSHDGLTLEQHYEAVREKMCGMTREVVDQ